MEWRENALYNTENYIIKLQYKVEIKFNYITGTSPALNKSILIINFSKG